MECPISPKEFYPELRGDYCNEIGLCGEEGIRQGLGNYPVSFHLLNEPGVDIEIEGFGIGIEVWNHSRQHAYLDKLKSVINNLSNCDFRFHVTSFISPEFRKMERDNGIITIDLGFQIIPKQYISHYQKHYGLKGKKTLNKRTLKIIRQRLRPIVDTIKKQQTRKAIEGLEAAVDRSGLSNIYNHSHVCHNTNNNTKDIANTSSSLDLPVDKDTEASYKSETNHITKKERDCILDFVLVMSGDSRSFSVKSADDDPKQLERKGIVVLEQRKWGALQEQDLGVNPHCGTCWNPSLQEGNAGWQGNEKGISGF